MLQWEPETTMPAPRNRVDVPKLVPNVSQGTSTAPDTTTEGDPYAYLQAQYKAKYRAQRVRLCEVSGLFISCDTPPRLNLVSSTISKSDASALFLGAKCHHTVHIDTSGNQIEVLPCIEELITAGIIYLVPASTYIPSLI